MHHNVNFSMTSENVIEDLYEFSCYFLFAVAGLYCGLDKPPVESLKVCMLVVGVLLQ